MTTGQRKLHKAGNQVRKANIIAAIAALPADEKHKGHGMLNGFQNGRYTPRYTPAQN